MLLTLGGSVALVGWLVKLVMETFLDQNGKIQLGTLGTLSPYQVCGLEGYYLD